MLIYSRIVAKKMLSFLFFILLFSFANAKSTSKYPFIFNVSPLVEKTYAELPLGAIKAKGWLLDMLKTQRSGATGNMDNLYPSVMGDRNGWLGGDGDQWERGPYWIDGLLPLAYLLDDEKLKSKVKPWIEWILNSQQESGYFGPSVDYTSEHGLQRDNSADWWPRMVVLKILQQYYSATQDERVLSFMLNYFKYQLETLPLKPLGNWTFWALYRVGDNLQAVHWLYNLTEESFLLELGELLHRQGHNFTHMFLHTDAMSTFNSIHCVNLAQGIKEPIIYFQQTHDSLYYCAVKKGLADIKKHNGQAQGMYGADEGLHGNNPTQGVELCAIVEKMFSLEKMIEITGDLDFVEELEKIAFNALPTQITDDFMCKQYFQQANQVKITRNHRNFYEDAHHDGTDIVFGTLTGYPCCFSNMHQAWSKFTQNLWYATSDGGLAALTYSPSEVTACVGKGVKITVTEDTFYPMDDKISFTFNVANKKKGVVEFPFHIRIPSWCKRAEIKINGKTLTKDVGCGIEIINRVWKTGDKLEVLFPMEVTIQDNWYENSISIERGPLVYALKIEEQWNKIDFEEQEKKNFGSYYWEVLPTSKWNYGILNFDKKKANDIFEVKLLPQKLNSDYFWDSKNAPIEIYVKAKEIPSWKIYNDMAGPLPYSVGAGGIDPIKKIVLIPYGCTTLRVSQFPLIH